MIIENLELIVLLLGILIGLGIMKFQSRDRKADLVRDRAKQAKDNYDKVVEMILKREFCKEGTRQFNPQWVVDMHDEITRAGLAAIDAALSD